MPQTKFHSINCILPPYMLRQIVDHGSELQRDKALETTHFSNLLREQRSEISSKRVVAFSPGEVTAAVKQRNIYSAEFGSSLPGKLIRSEGGPATNDVAADEAYDGAGATYDLYWELYQRNSIDNQGMRLDSTVHYQKGYDNAFWNSQQMVYGDGDEDMPPAQRLFNRFTIAIDIIGHELTHGVTEYTANLQYANQPGALNESFSDVFGSLVKQRNLGQLAKDANWIIGEGLFTANVNGVGIRSMKAPGTAYNDPVLGKDPQPGHMSNYVTTLDDNGGVHINSGIPNQAFYRVAMEIGGNAWEKAGLIWYTALRDKIRATSTFQDAANQTFSVAGTLYGINSLEQKAVRNGWAGVGITVVETTPTPPPTPTPTPPPPTNPGCLSLFNIFRGS